MMTILITQREEDFNLELLEEVQNKKTISSELQGVSSLKINSMD
jgi:hypothetical protein